MKNTAKRLFLFLLAAVIIATVVQPSITTDAARIYKQRRITITKNSRQVVDSLGGAKSYYRKGPNDGSNKFYSCAAFVKRYYKKVYGKNVNNLLYNRTPHTSGDSFVRVKTPQIGDILCYDGHVEFYAGKITSGNKPKVYNCGSTNAIRSKSLVTTAGRTTSKITYILRLKNL